MSNTLTDSDAANAGIRKGYDVLERIGRQRLWTLSALVVVVVVFGIYAIASDGWDLFMQRLVDGLSNGFIYSAMALALVLIYKATETVSFAQGELMMLGAFNGLIVMTSKG